MEKCTKCEEIIKKTKQWKNSKYGLCSKCYRRVYNKYKAACKRYPEKSIDIVDYINSNNQVRIVEKGKPRYFYYIRSEYEKMLRTPKWVDMMELVEIYVNRPDGYHVDHIIPLKGENVSGLHVPWNLQYLPAKQNIKKSNKT